MLVDSHCHIHDPEFRLDNAEVLQRAAQAGVGQMICIGTSAADSQAAVDYAVSRPSVWAAVGMHPHDAAKVGEDDLELLMRLAASPKVVAVGEIGLDYHYDNSPRAIQQQVLKDQLAMAVSLNLPCVFHVRQATDDFLAILDEYPGARGVVHSFSAGLADLEKFLSRGLYIGLNGIITFSKNDEQLAAARAVPLDKLLLETDAPFLTPTPKRGTINEPANLTLVWEFLSKLRGEASATLAEATTANVHRLFPPMAL